MKIQISIKTKLIALVPIVVVNLLLFSFMSYQRSVDGIREVAKDDLNTMVKIVKDFTRNERNHERKFLEDICNRDLVIGKSGFIFFVSPDGEMYIHKKVQGENWAKKPHIKKILEMRNGVIRYISPKTKTYKIAAFQYCESLDKIIVASAFEADLIGDIQKQLLRETVISVIITIVVLGIIVGLVIRSVLKPIRNLSDTFKEIVSDDESINLGSRVRVYSNDEVGLLAQSFNQLLNKIQQLIRQNIKNAELLAQLSRHQEASAQQLAATTIEMSAQTDTIEKTTQQASENMTTVSGTAEDMSHSVHSVASAIEEMSATANEISGYCKKESEIANQASVQVEETNQLMSQLEVSASEIGNVLEAIKSISAQTNLLALNATIEAASAGEAGKGFAVVANEVKELAKQTAHLTDEIGTKVDAIGSSTDGSIKAIKVITSTIEEVNKISDAIVLSVEQQSNTIHEIADTMSTVNTASQHVSENVKQSSEGVFHIAKNIGGFNEAIHELTRNMDHLQEGTSKLANMSQEVTEDISKFKV